jgi:putative spermidine/putrescine transport system substrate-binding protein
MRIRQLDRSRAKSSGEAGAQPPVAEGGAAIVSAWNGRIYKAIAEDKKNFKIVWDAQAPDYDLWGIPKGNPRLDAAYRFVNYASQPQAMANQTKYISYGPANKDAIRMSIRRSYPSTDGADNMITI